MGSPESSRKPWSYYILNEMGRAFATGAVGGSATHFIEGAYNSPKGSRFIGGTQAVSMNVPRFAGSFAALGGVYSTLVCSMVYLRQKEDPWNSIIAGAATGGLLTMRQGVRVASVSAAYVGVYVAFEIGAAIMLNKQMDQPQNMMIEEHVPRMQMGQIENMLSESQNHSTKKEEVEPSSGSKTEVSESFDASLVPSFEYK